MGFLYGEACGEPCRGGRCLLTLGHGGPHKSRLVTTRGESFASIRKIIERRTQRQKENDGN